MNSLKYIFAIAAIVVSSMAFAQSPKKPVTATFKVEGNCGMCKDRIENALSVKGIKTADWNVKTKMLTVVYVPAKISEEQIHKIIAKAGHDTEKVTATKEDYQDLHGCCKYRENPE
jgi:periplasmic mercuric ion binding protein